MTCAYLNNFIFHFYTAYAPFRKRTWKRGFPCRKHEEFYLCLLHTIGSVYAKYQLYKMFSHKKTYHVRTNFFFITFLTSQSFLRVSCLAFLKSGKSFLPIKTTLSLKRRKSCGTNVMTLEMWN